MTGWWEWLAVIAVVVVWLLVGCLHFGDTTVVVGSSYKANDRITLNVAGRVVLVIAWLPVQLLAVVLLFVMFLGRCIARGGAPLPSPQKGVNDE